ncbi:MAG: sulfite exporter TauE/SafE family protein [Candidatus Accumulibacter sp.]|nr:sulfite exporter TauE/SafE family protein [Accumulibacter sp.]
MEGWLAYIGLGLFSGFAAGLLGIGGGVVLVPVLTMIFTAQSGFPADAALRMALGTSMATILFTSISSLRAHHRHGAVMWRVVGQITPGILAGTALGTLLASRIPARPLGIVFALFILFTAAQMILDLKPKAARALPGAPGVLGVGMVIGIFSALVAIGGGTLTVPFLTWCNVRVQNAIGTSAAVGCPIAIGGTLGYIYNGWHDALLPSGALGYVFLPALLWTVPFSMFAAPLGARVTYRLPMSTLKRVFAGLLILLAARMLWKLFV